MSEHFEQEARAAVTVDSIKGLARDANTQGNEGALSFLLGYLQNTLQPAAFESFTVELDQMDRRTPPVRTPPMRLAFPRIFDPNSTTPTLERLVDSHGLRVVLVAFAELCGLKSEHLAVNLQDTTAAKEWDKIGVNLLKIAESAP